MVHLVGRFGRRGIVIASGAAIFFLLAPAVGVATADELPEKRFANKGAAFRLNHFQIIEGSEAAARAYYRDTLSKQTGFESPEIIETTTIKNLLVYFGYSNINARDLHGLASDALMALSAQGDILATRFFAPKITDVHDKPAEVPELGFGWRKLVRLKAKIGSAADANGMQAVYILQNVVVPNVADDPFAADKIVSNFNQAIMIRKKLASGPFTDDQRSAYFLTYGRLVKLDASEKPDKSSGEFQDDGLISFNLLATFNENDRNPETNSAAKFFFVPESCEQCHGAVPSRGKLNFLDTDHWFDRVTPSSGLADAKFSQEDFTALSNSPFGVLYDGGKDTTSTKFNAAFDVIRTLNNEIKAQNEDVGGGNNFQLNAVKKWLDLHASDSQHVPPIKRGFGAKLWDESDEQKKLVYYLNRYCYRCHSSIRFNVFDRQAVTARASGIGDRVLDIGSAVRWMPQDRIFPGLVQQDGEGQATGDLKEFLDLLNQLQ